MECFYLYILLVLDVLCKGKPELQTFFLSVIVLRAWVLDAGALALP